MDNDRRRHKAVNDIEYSIVPWMRMRQMGVLEMETEEGRWNENKRGSGGDCGGAIGEQDRGKDGWRMGFIQRW